MKIEVDRTAHSEGLTFTIKVTQPHDAPFSEIDIETMNFLDLCKQSVENLAPPEHHLVGQVVNSIHTIKQETFDRVRKRLVFAIRHSLESKIEPICQEVYNWIYDQQKPALKKWMQEFDPQRTKYYFDNDKTIESDGEDELD